MTSSLFKPNIHELEEWCGHRLHTDEEVVTAGRRLIHLGVSLLTISMGEKGSIAMDQTEAFRVTPSRLFQEYGRSRRLYGGNDDLLHAKQQESNGNSSLDCSTGTLTASKEGTQVCTLEEVKENVHRVQVIKL